MSLPILYSYRRCPYAMRARMALNAAGIELEIREISLRDKPAHMLQVSPKGTVPVLVLPTGEVLEQSLDIMYWALDQHDPQEWLRAGQDLHLADELITMNDGEFKRALDQYKYAIRFPEHPPEVYRARGEVFLQQLEERLENQPYLLMGKASLADVAIFPFVRQFAMVEPEWFGQAAYPALRAWLTGWLNSALFGQVMEKYPTYAE